MWHADGRLLRRDIARAMSDTRQSAADFRAAGRAYDVVVIGGGSAGCVVAARLSEDAGRRVLLLEAGPDPRPVPDLLSNPARRAEASRSGYVARHPTRRIDGSTFDSLAGHVLGGGSAVNFMDFLRPLRHDFEAWAERGGNGWSYEAMLPLMRAMETDHDFLDDPIHGSVGPVDVARPFTFGMPLGRHAAGIIDRAAQIGLPIEKDMNAPDPYGICAPPCNIRDGRRLSAAAAYLEPARERPNLDVVTAATVTTIMLSNRRIDGVQYVAPGGQRTISTDRIVLAAGVYGSPQILMLSGVGPPAALEQLGIPVRLALSGIGSGYQDHAVVRMAFRAVEPLEASLPRIRLLIRSSSAAKSPDFHIIPRPIEARGLLPFTMHLLEHRRTGNVSLGVARPGVPMRVEAHLLEDPSDVAAMGAAMRYVEGFVEPLSAYAELVEPEPGIDRTAFMRSTHDSYHHGVGTCRMGPANDPTTVVDGHLRLLGVDGVWVADASVLPSVTHSNTNAAAMLVGEVAARSVIAAERGGA